MRQFWISLCHETQYLVWPPFEAIIARVRVRLYIPASSIPMARSLRFPVSRGILKGGGNWILTICFYSPRSKEKDYHSRFYLALPNHGERTHNGVSLVTYLALLVSSFLGIRRLSDHNSTIASFVSNDNSRERPNLSQNCDKTLAFLLLLSIYLLFVNFIVLIQIDVQYMPPKAQCFSVLL